MNIIIMKKNETYMCIHFLHFSHYIMPQSDIWTMCHIDGNTSKRRCCVVSISFQHVSLRYISFSRPGPLFTKRWDVFPSHLVKYRSRETDWIYNALITIKFDRHLASAIAEVPVKFHIDWKILNPTLAASSLHEILWKDDHPLNE